MKHNDIAMQDQISIECQIENNNQPDDCMNLE